MAKCAIETGRPVPGTHGAKRRGKVSHYGTRLREKQRLRRSYGMQESQFRLFFHRAVKRRGVTGEILLQMLEMRLDNLIYRLGFAPSRKAAREFVRHKHVLVNGKRASIPSMVLHAEDRIAVRNKTSSKEYAKQNLEVAEAHGLVSWLSLNKEALSGTILHVPSWDEIAPTVNEQLIVELYSK